MKPVNEITFEEKISAYLDDLSYFSESCREIHDTPCWSLEPCIVKCFCDELFHFVQNRGKFYPEKAFFIDLCKQWPSSFNDMFTAVIYKKLCLEYFKKNEYWNIVRLLWKLNVR